VCKGFDNKNFIPVIFFPEKHTGPMFHWRFRSGFLIPGAYRPFSGIFPKALLILFDPWLARGKELVLPCALFADIMSKTEKLSQQTFLTC
jgi:hypothetical protein